MSSTIQRSNCSICLEWLLTDSGQEVVFTRCRHVFHKDCVKTWVSTHHEQRNSCPTCRNSMGRRRKLFLSTAPFSLSSSQEEPSSVSREDWECDDCSAKMSASHDVMQCFDCYPASVFVYLCPKCVVSNHQGHKLGIMPLTSSEVLEEGLGEIRERISNCDVALERLRGISEHVKRMSEGLEHEKRIATEALAQLSATSTVPLRRFELLLAPIKEENLAIDVSRRLVDAYDDSVRLTEFSSNQSAVATASPVRSLAPRPWRSPPSYSSSSSQRWSEQTLSPRFNDYDSDESWYRTSS
uniref:RING-type domain-containing protein n=1 Tax=Steinernema glaseri TaxID=37863 RepID=A0A1I7XZY3_9BILA